MEEVQFFTKNWTSAKILWCLVKFLNLKYINSKDFHENSERENELSLLFRGIEPVPEDTNQREEYEEDG